MRRVQHGVGHFRGARAVLGLEHGPSAEHGHVVVVAARRVFLNRVALELRLEGDLTGAVDAEHQRRAVVSGRDQRVRRHPYAAQEGQVARLELEDGHSLGGVGHG